MYDEDYEGPDGWPPGCGCLVVFLISAGIWALVLGWAVWRTLR